MKKKTLYIIIAILVLLNIGQFVYFYSVVSDLKSELKIMESKIPAQVGKYD
jgi:cell division protein FtsL